MLPGKINTLVILSSHTRITPDEKLMSYRAKIRRSHGENRLLSKKTLRGLTLHPRGYITSIKDWLQKCSQNFESIWKAYKTQSSKSEFGVITLNWLEKLTIKFFFHGINMGSLLCFFFILDDFEMKVMIWDKLGCLSQAPLRKSLNLLNWN